MKANVLPAGRPLALLPTAFFHFDPASCGPDECWPKGAVSTRAPEHGPQVVARHVSFRGSVCEKRS
jgi:hypothetical protein